MIHKKCDHKVQLDLSNLYELKSPSISISTKGLAPGGVVEIISSGKRSHVSLYCPECEISFSSREEFEENILEQCTICREFFKPSELIITDFAPFICEKCTKEAQNKGATTNRYMLVLQEAIKNISEFPTLLTILMKKI